MVAVPRRWFSDDVKYDFRHHITGNKQERGDCNVVHLWAALARYCSAAQAIKRAIGVGFVVPSWSRSLVSMENSVRGSHLDFLRSWLFVLRWR